MDKFFSHSENFEINKETQLQAPPERWSTFGDFYRELGRSRNFGSPLIEQYRISNPEWFGTFLAANGKPAEYLSPEMANLLKKESERYEPNPEGWMKLRDLGEVIGKSGPTAKKIAYAYETDHPGSIQEYLSENGQPAFYVSPELLESVKASTVNLESAPEGWLTNRQTSEHLKTFKKKTQLVANQYLESNPEWFKTYRDSMGRDFMYFAPQLIEKIAEQVKKPESPPSGWMHKNELAKLTGRTGEGIRFSYMNYREDHPEWFKQFTDENNTVREYFAPELVDIVLETADREKQAPEGWLNMYRLGLETKKGSNFLETLIKPYKMTNPEWFKKYIGGHVYSTHFAPELVALVKEKANEYQYAPEGWMTVSKLARKLGTAYDTIDVKIKKIIEQHPDQTGEYLDNFNKLLRFYSPEVVRIVRAELLEVPAVPEGWMSKQAVANLVGKSAHLVNKVIQENRIQHPEWVKRYMSETGHVYEHLSPELIKLVQEYAEKYKVAPKDWKNTAQAEQYLQKARSFIERYIEPYKISHPEWFGTYIDNLGRPILYLSPEILKILSKEIGKYENAPDDWETISMLSDRLDRGFYFIKPKVDSYRASNPEWFKICYGKHGQPAEYLSPELIALVEQKSTAYEAAPEGWHTNSYMARSLNWHKIGVHKFVSQYKTTHPEWFKVYFDGSNRPNVHYSPELIDLVKARYNQSELAPEGWYTSYKAAEELGVYPSYILKSVRDYRTSNPNWFKFYKISTGNVCEHYSPELIEQVKTRVEKYIPKGRRQTLQRELGIYLDDVASNETVDAEEFRRVLSIFGNSSVIDVLYKFHPKYKKLPIEYVKSILADYLGDYLSVNRPFSLENITKKGLEFLEEQRFQDQLEEILKRDVITYYNLSKRSEKDLQPMTAVDRYLDELRTKATELGHPGLNSVIDDIELYYGTIFLELDKPDYLVNEVKSGRAFPEFYQLVNIKEISDKKRLLLADDMGVGKSASAIMAKEFLGVDKALIIAPSNVIETWRDYLSDKKNQQDEQVGYFKPGAAPHVLTVDSIEALKQVSKKHYDYILVSHERMNEEYASTLKQTGFDMLIIDEVHKFKNIKTGVRSNNVLELARDISGEDKYLALLSGTPMPNKVEDIAFTLKMLYPEDFINVSNKALAQQIINSDAIDLRGKLLPRMQMKKLTESVEMPNLEESNITFELSEVEQSIYEMLLEEDEIEITDKMRILRQYLLNPDLLEATPSIESTKMANVSEELRKAFLDKNKVVMFVNGYVTGVIKGEKNIIKHLNLPVGIDIQVIHGDVNHQERTNIQRKLNSTTGKMLLLVSGQTADVGVDFSGAESVFFYNEPWTRFEQRQELGRVYRPGLKNDLESKTFISSNTIEEGIHLYILAKERAIEKLLHGLPRSEIENKLLTEDEKQIDPNLEVNPELAKYYFSDWNKMAKIFGYVKEIGEENFLKFLDNFGREYADCYLNLGNRSYQSNVARVNGTVINQLIKENEQDPELLKILDIASGPEMLKRHVVKELQDRTISMDINKEHFLGSGENRIVGSFNEMPFADQSIDYANFALALHYTQFIPSRDNYERLEALLELNRILKDDGTALLNMIYSVDFRDEKSFKELIDKIGFSIVEEYSDSIKVDRNYNSKLFTLRKRHHFDKDVTTTVNDLGAELLEGLKLTDTKISLKDSRKIIEEFGIKGRDFKIILNEEDQALLNEEKTILNTGNALKESYGAIENISVSDIVSNDFIRILIKDKYVLFKRLDNGNGVVIIK